MHRNLVHGFFSSARGMLRANGEIHVNHKTTAPFCRWNIRELASKNWLVLIGCVDFEKKTTQVITTKEGMVQDVMNHFLWVSVVRLNSDCPLQLEG